MNGECSDDPLDSLRFFVEVDGAEFVVDLDPLRCSFSNIVTVLASKLNVPQHALLHRRLSCVRCRRALWLQEEKHQRLPLDCCREKSLRLVCEAEEREDCASDISSEDVKNVLGEAALRRNGSDTSSDRVAKSERSLAAVYTFDYYDSGDPSAASTTQVRSPWMTDGDVERAEAPTADHRSESLELAACAEETLHMRVTLPDSKPFDVYLGSNVKVSDLLDTALHNRKWFPVEQIRHQLKDSLTGRLNSTLAECGVHSGDDIVITACAPPSVHISVFTPEKFDSEKIHRLSLAPEEWSWRRIKEKVSQYTAEPFGPTALVHQIVTIERDASTEIAMAFLDDFSGLHFNASREEQPQVCVMKETYPLLVSGHGVQWADPHTTSIFDSRWILLMSGFATFDLRRESMFVSLQDSRRFFNVATGSVFESREAAVAHARRGVAWRGFVLLLESGAALPRWRLPAQESPRTWLRDGVRLEVRAGKVRKTSSNLPTTAESLWSDLRRKTSMAKAVEISLRHR